MKRRNIRKPIVVLALVAAMLFPTAVHATEAQDGGDSGSVILNGGTGGEAGNAEAQEVYQELLDSISFIAADPTWSNIMNIKGVTQLVYDATIPEHRHTQVYICLCVYCTTRMQMPMEQLKTTCNSSFGASNAHF